jgi:hypothetical protein
MSVLGTNTLWGSSNYNSFYIPNQAPPVNVSSIGTQYPQTNANISSIFTDRITIDGIALDGSSAGGGQLLLNGVAVATVNQNVSSIANWATYPALSTITAGSGGGVINMATGNFTTLNTFGAGSVSSLNVSSINGINANAAGGAQINTTNQYTYSTSNTVLTTSPAQVAGVATGIFNIISGKQYYITCPISGYIGTPTGVIYLSVSLGSNSGQTWPVSLDSAATFTTGTLEPRVIQGVVTATATGATAGGLYLYAWTGPSGIGANSSTQIYVNPQSGAGLLNPSAIVLTQLN